MSFRSDIPSSSKHSRRQSSLLICPSSVITLIPLPLANPVRNLQNLGHVFRKFSSRLLQRHSAPILHLHSKHFHCQSSVLNCPSSVILHIPLSPAKHVRELQNLGHVFRFSSPLLQRHSAPIFHLHSKHSHCQSSLLNCPSSVITSHFASSRQA